MLFVMGHVLHENLERCTVKSRVLGHGCFDSLFIYLVLISSCCFVVLFSILLFRLQLSVLRPNRSQVVRIELPCLSVS